MKKKTILRSMLVAAIVVIASPFTNQAQPVFQDQMNDGSSWDVNASGVDYSYAFNYDYSADGIPEAPNSLGTDDATRGAKMEANLSSGTGQYFTLFPKNQLFSGSYRVRFDAWMNWGASGTTEFMGGGIGYDDFSADLVSGAQAIATGDGGSSSDWRAFKDGFYVPGANMSAGTRQGADPYYADFLPSVNGSIAGSPAFQWITWEFEVVGNTVTIFIEKPDKSRLEIITYDKNDTSDGSSGVSIEGNISLFYADFFTSVAAPTNSTFGLVDNVVVSTIEANIVTIVATTPDAYENGPTAATFRFSRTVTGSPLTVNYSIDGLAENGVDYTSGGGALSGMISFGASESAVDLVVLAVDDNISEPEEDIVITVAEGDDYIESGTATATIEDNDPALLIVSVDAASMYERHPSDYASVKITQWGDPSLIGTVTIEASTFTFGGSAVQNTDFVLNSSLFPIFPFEVDTVITNFVNPLDNSSYTGDKTIDVGLVAGAGFTVSEATAELTIIDDENPEATVLYSNPLTDAADASNWNVTYANGSGNPTNDYQAWFGYDLTSDAAGGGVIGLPPGGATRALRVTINKTNESNAGVNLYLTNAAFSGDYAVRFNMNIIYDSVDGFTTHGPIFGINHDGTQTNWWGSSVTAGGPWAADGVWYWISADGGANAGDYMLFTGDGGALPNEGWAREPTLYNTAFNRLFKGVGGFNPRPGPYSQPGLSSAGDAGLVSNDAPLFGGDTSTWTDVEIKQVGGVVTLSLNKIPVFTYENTTTFTSGHLMLGYDDPFNSLGQAAGAVYYANVIVVDLSPPVPASITIETPPVVAANGDVTLTWNSEEAFTYSVIRTDALGGAPTTIATGIAGEAGTTSYTDTTANGTANFYSVSSP